MSEAPATGDWSAPAVPGYDLLGELGRGGMGVVYKARQVSSGRLVALKVIRDGALAGPQALARFRLEAEAAARVRHPNVVQIFEVGEHAGRPYFAMELVEGGSLDRHLAGQPLPPQQAAELIRTLAVAVAHAHEQQIIHRDLKPANVLLSGDRGQGTGDRRQETGDREEPSSGSSLSPVSCLLSPKIADFGLAKRLDSDSTAWTREGAVLGTPGYMAPEQAAGRANDVGPATDVYALGAMLYEALTGRLPFTAGSWDLTIQQVIHDEPARLPPDVPRDLETICLKCLEKEPARRYVDAGALADDGAAGPAGRARRLPDRRRGRPRAAEHRLPRALRAAAAAGGPEGLPGGDLHARRVGGAAAARV
jgi:serine/threonine protein kinase